MSLAEYDTSILPIIERPFTSEVEVTKKYLGGRAVTGEQYATLNIFIKTNAEAKALYDFWKDDLESGILPFLAPLPTFGDDNTAGMPNAVIQFIDDLSMENIELHWKTQNKMKVLGTVQYVTDNSLEYVTDLSGDFVYSNPTSNSNKEITWLS